MIIHRYIVHILDKNNESPILNDYEGKCNLEIDKFLEKTIKSIHKDKGLRKGNFNKYEDNIIRKCCDDIRHYDDVFVDSSKEIASYLFENMKTYDDIESCDLAVVLYSQKDATGVAIIKLDYKELLNHSITLENEKFNISINKNTSLLSNLKPKQAALIGATSLTDEYNLLVLDKKGEKLEKESSFVKRFLGAYNIEDDSYITKKFIELTPKIIDISSKDMKRNEDAKSLMSYMLKENSVFDIDKFIDHAGVETVVKEILEDRGFPNSFNIDKKVADRELKNRNIKTSSGFKLSGNILDFEDPMKYSVRKNENGTFDLVLKNIEFYEG